MMRRIILNIALSLDGYIAREDGSIDWLPEGDSDYGMNKFMESIDIVLLGRTTYEQILTFGVKYPYANKKSYVFSRKTKTEDKNNVEFVSDMIRFSRKLKETPGKDIWLVGGAEIISYFFEAGLVDEVILSYIPNVIGKGIPLFKNVNEDLKFRIIKSVEYDGLMQLHLKISN